MIKEILSQKITSIQKFIAIVIIAMAAFSPLHLGNQYLRASQFDRVTITQEQSIPALAAKYTSNPEEQAQLAQAICDINELNADTTLATGYTIQIPILNDSSNVQVAQNP